MLLDCTGTDPYSEVPRTLKHTGLMCSLECQQNVKSPVGVRKLSEQSPKDKNILVLNEKNLVWLLTNKCE